MKNHAEILNLVNHEAETVTLAAMRDDIAIASALAQQLDAAEFYDPRRRVVFEAIVNLLRGIEPIDTAAIVAESRHVAQERKQDVKITSDFVDSLKGEAGKAIEYAHTLKRLAWLRQASDFAFWLVQVLQANPDPSDLFIEAQEKWQHLQPARQSTEFVYGWETLERQQETIDRRIREQAEGITSRFDWPWVSWRELVRPLRPGMVGIVAAPDGIGKTTYLEMIAEYWAYCGHNVVYVHLEDDLDYKLDRRLARLSMVAMNKIEDGELTVADMEAIRQADQQMTNWAHNLHYYHAAGKSMTDILRELETRVSEGVCDAVVFDYLDKVQATRGQARLFGDNTWERQGNDMEALKTFAERNRLPVFTATQGNKSMQGGGTQTRQAIQGSGQKSQKSQLVLILTRDIVGDDGLRDTTGQEIARPGEYSPIVKVRIDKQNRGRTGSFEQVIKGEHFRVGDKPRKQHA